MNDSNLDDIRQLYMQYRVKWYMFQNPTADMSKARKYARVAWARKVKKWMNSTKSLQI